jgi:hypothetical protein
MRWNHERLGAGSGALRLRLLLDFLVTVTLLAERVLGPTGGGDGWGRTVARCDLGEGGWG